MDYSNVYAEIAGYSRAIAGIAGTHFNAELTYQITTSGGGFVFDDFGNPIPEPATTETKVLKARLYQKRNPTLQTEPGADRDTLYFEGVLVDPLTAPEPLPNIVDARISSRNGIWTWAQKAESAIAHSADVELGLGQAIAGYLQVQQGG